MLRLALPFASVPVPSTLAPSLNVIVPLGELPITVMAGVADAVMGLRTKEVTVSKDEGTREGTTKEGISGIKPALPGGVITAGNASQFSDGAGACVVVNAIALATGKQENPL